MDEFHHSRRKSRRREANYGSMRWHSCKLRPSAKTGCPRAPAERTARHLHGEVILYADIKTQSIQKFLAVSEYRRKKQVAYNEENHITPRSVSRAVEDSLATYQSNRDAAHSVLREGGVDIDISETIKELEEEMLTAANNLEFEKAALYRDQVNELKRSAGMGAASTPRRQVSYKKGKKRKVGV